MNAFQRSWEITKLTFHVMKADKELFLFPILSGIFSLLFIAAMVFPTLITGLFSGTDIGGALFYGAIFIIYFGLAFIATFFNVCVVYTAKTRFSGKNATFGESLRFAAGKIHLIFYWSLIAATVGLILRILDSMAERAKGIGRTIAKGIIAMMGAAWSIVTLFVVPAMVYHDLGPIDAIKSSAKTIRKTWGESLIRHFGLGFVQMVFFFGGLVFFWLLFVALSAVAGIYGAIISLVLAATYIIFLFIFFAVANTIFNTALYQYASTGHVPHGFPKKTMEHAFESRKERGNI